MTPHPITAPDDDHTIAAGRGRTSDRRAAFNSSTLANGGLYVAGTEPAARSEVLMQHLVQVAHRGSGFCYIHPGRDAPLELLAKLPEKRLEDVIWVDLRRQHLETVHSLDVPRDRRVRITPLSTGEQYTDSHALETPPIEARVTDVLDVCNSLESVDPTVLVFLDAVLSVAIEREATVREVDSMLQPFLEPDRETERREVAADKYIVEPRIANAVLTVLDRDSSALDRAADLLDAFTVPPHDAVFRDRTTVSFEGAVRSDAIVLVAGDGMPDARGPRTADDESGLGTQLLAVTVLRRFWEALQSVGQPQREMYPVAVDCVDRVLPRNPTVLREVLADHQSEPSRIALWLAGPAPGHLYGPLADHVDAGIDGWVLTSRDPDDELERLLTRLARAVDRGGQSVSNGFSRCPSWIVPFPESAPCPFEPFEPYPRQLSDAEIADAITRSVTTHGTSTPDQSRGDIPIDT